ncbi:hypothetical protein BH23CHL2_BH23CHL2_08380 [soil metagenome]
MMVETGISAPRKANQIPLTPLSMGIPAAIFGIAAISIPVATSIAFDLTATQSSSL